MRIRIAISNLMQGRLRAVRPLAVVFVSLVSLVNLSSVVAQQQPSAARDQMQGRVKILEEIGAWIMELARDPGVLLAEGKNTVPAGQFRLKTYRIEEVALRNPIRAEIDGQPAQINRAWRFTITGGPFRMRDAAAIIWIDDKPVGFGIEGPHLDSISVLVFDRTLMRNGASIALSYGENDPGRTELPEKINLSSSR